MNLFNHLREYLDWGIEHRRHLHRIPELGREEHKTTAYCQEVLANLGYEIRPSFSTGFTADLMVGEGLKMVAFRADMDALPARERLEEDYCSQHEGIAHLCGHDVHMAIALTAARFMAEHKDELNYNVRFLFQPSEEMFVGGAKEMIAAGCLEGVDEVYGLHNDPTIESGRIHMCRGAMSSNGDSFTIRIKGRSAHASTPHLGLDAIREASRMITEFNSIVANNCSPMQPALIAVGTLQAGEASNIIATNAEMAGSVRSFDDATQQTMLRRMEETFEESRRRGFEVSMDVQGYPAIINEEPGFERMLEAAGKVMAADAINANCKPMVGSEDFSYFTRERPGGFFFLGSGNRAKGICNPLHANPFLVEEECIAWGAAIFAALVM